MDNPEAHEEYVDFYSKDATFIMASTAVKGHEGLFQLFHMYHAVVLRLNGPSTPITAPEV
jgi:hypothetical protein